MKSSKNRIAFPRVLAAGMVSVVLVAAGGYGISFAGESAASAHLPGDGTPAFEVNAAGQTFGTCVEVPCGEEMPELVLVVATNGQEGYVYSDELAEAEGANIESAEELVSRTEEQDAQFVEAAVEVLQDEGYVVDDSVLEQFIEEARFGEGIDAAIQECAADLKLSSARAIDDVRAVQEDVTMAVEEGIIASGATLKVYASDGSTVIGEFIVGGV